MDLRHRELRSIRLASAAAATILLGYIFSFAEGAPPVPKLAQKIKAQGAIRINVGAQVDSAVSDEEAEASFVVPKREQLILLSRAEKLLTEERYAEAVRLLGEILNGDQDGALPRQNNERVRFLKAEAQRLVGSMEKAGHDAYELQFGKQAERLLEESVRKGDVTGLEAVVRQFFHTQSGYEATHLLGLYHMDHGRPLAAALAFERLVQQPNVRDAFEPELSYRLALCWHWAGMGDAAKRVMIDLKQRQPDARLNLNGKETRLFETEDEIAGWLAKNAGARPVLRGHDGEQWAMFRGGATRNTVSDGGRPLLNYRWRVPVSDDPHVMEFVSQLRENHLDQNVTGIPALHPLAVGGLVLMRTSQQLLAVDFATGKRIWEVKVDEQLEKLFEGRKGVVTQGSFNLTTALDQRLWEDNTFGTMSSDGEFVYSIEDLGLTTSPGDQQRMVVMPNGRRRPDTLVRRHNRLAAHELATQGKLKWSLGGPAGDDEFPEAGTFFLGAPLPLGGRLYVLAEAKGEIRLLAIDPKKDPFRGEKLVEWSLPLATVEQSVFDNSERRLAGVSPSYADGVMVCPTSAGVVVAVDLTTRSLLWGRSFPRANNPSRHNRIAMMRMGFNDGSQENRDGWIDSSVTIADGKAILTPVESDKLICLRLTDGELLWEKNRDVHKDGLYLACVEDGKAVVVGRSALRAFKLEDGAQSWELSLSSSGAPSGRGFANGGRYYLPLNSAEVITVDLAAGKELERARSRQGVTPGNLICHQGAVISQSVESLDCFYQSAIVEREVSEKLKENPDDPEALALGGELLLDEGRVTEAAEQLRKSLKLRDDPRTKELLVDALLEGLRIDFAKHRGDSNEIESLISQPAQWDHYLRLVAAGMHAAGEHLAAFDAYLRLASLKLEGPALARTEPGLMVRRDRWVQARLATLREGVADAERAQMDAMIEARLQAALAREKGVADELRQFLRYFGMHPAAETAREELAARLSERESALEIELLSRRAVRLGDEARAGAATARLAEMMQHLDRPEQAAACYERLIEKYAEAEVLPGKTGRQLLDAVPADSPVRQALVKESPWPSGMVDVSKQAQQGQNFRTFAMEVETIDNRLLSPVTVDFDPQRNMMVGRDSLNRQLWQIPLTEISAQNNMNFGFQPGTNRARANGHLLIVTLGFQVAAIDTLGGAKGSARILWKQDLNSTMPGVNPFQFGIQHMRMNVPWGGQPRMVATDGSGRQLGQIGPCTDDYVCFLQGRRLMALDPLTGETLWTRQGMSPNGQLFGDEQYIFVAEENQALVLRASDGMELGRRPIPAMNERMVTIGRKILAWTQSNGKVRIKMIDPWTQTDLWTHETVLGARAWVMGQESVGIMEQEGMFTLVGLENGAVLTKSPVDREPALSEIYLFSTRERYILIANTQFQANGGFAGINPIPGGNDCTQIHGKIYGFDRKTGKQVWSLKMERQGMMLNQPAELPVMVFAAHVYKRDPNNQNNITTSMALACLDKRNGRIVYQDDSPNSIGQYDLVARPEAKAVDLRLPNQVVTLTFTGKALPDAGQGDGEKADAEKKMQSRAAPPTAPGQAARAIVNGFQKFFNKQAGGLVDDDEDIADEEEESDEEAEMADEDDPFGEDASDDEDEGDDQSQIQEDKVEAIVEGGAIEIQVDAIPVQVFPLQRAVPARPARPAPLRLIPAQPLPVQPAPAKPR